jgi:hypothetical protein
VPDQDSEAGVQKGVKLLDLRTSWKVFVKHVRRVLSISTYARRSILKPPGLIYVGRVALRSHLAAGGKAWNAALLSVQMR